MWGGISFPHRTRTTVWKPPFTDPWVAIRAAIYRSAQGPGSESAPRSAFSVFLGTWLRVPQRVLFECFPFRPGPLSTPVNGGPDRNPWVLVLVILAAFLPFSTGNFLVSEDRKKSPKIGKIGDAPEQFTICWEVRNGVGVDGVGVISPFFTHFSSFFTHFSPFLTHCSPFFTHFSASPRGQGQTTAIYCKNGEFHSDPVCTDPMQDFPNLPRKHYPINLENFKPGNGNKNNSTRTGVPGG